MTTTHGEMHGEHRQWSSDNAMWRDDLEAWKRESDRALAELGRLEHALREHHRELAGHRETIAAEELALREHERALAAFEAGGEGEELIALARSHKQAADDHARRRREHEDLKKRHHTAMACWGLLVEALVRPEPAAAGTSGKGAARIERVSR
jgi:hypothetical protein